MNLKEYLIECEKTCPNLGSDFKNELHMVIGVATEAGELLDAYKKNLAYDAKLDAINIGEEIADCIWYLVNLCRMRGLDMEKLLENNIKKLRQRYPDGFSSKDATNRDLEKEREILCSPL